MSPSDLALVYRIFLLGKEIFSSGEKIIATLQKKSGYSEEEKQAIDLKLKELENKYRNEMKGIIGE